MSALGFLGMPSGAEWFVVLIVALLLFGSRLPSVMRSLGKSVTEFKKGLHEVEDEIAKVADEEEAPSGPSGDDSSAPPPSSQT